jgi:hypothetical protein
MGQALGPEWVRLPRTALCPFRYRELCVSAVCTASFTHVRGRSHAHSATDCSDTKLSVNLASICLQTIAYAAQCRATVDNVVAVPPDVSSRRQGRREAWLQDPRQSSRLASSTTPAAATTAAVDA